MAGRGNMMSSEYVPTGRITQGYGTHRAPAAEDSAADEKEPLKESSVEKPIPVEGKTGPRIRMNQPSADQAFGDGVTEAAPPVKPIIRDTAPTVSTNSSENVEEEVFEDPRLIAERLKQAGKDIRIPDPIGPPAQAHAPSLHRLAAGIDVHSVLISVLSRCGKSRQEEGDCQGAGAFHMSRLGVQRFSANALQYFPPNMQ